MPRSYRIRLVANQDGTVSAENEHGARLVMGPSSADRFSPVEVFVAALGGCSGMDFVELMEKQRRPLAPVQIEVTAERTSGNGRNLAWLRVTYRVEVDGDDAAKVERARSMISEKTCTVSRTLAHGSSVEHVSWRRHEPAVSEDPRSVDPLIGTLTNGRRRMAAELERRIDAFYALPIARFTLERDALAKELQAAGDREATRRVKGLGKPVVAAWALNLLAREDAPGIQELLELGARLRAAHRRACRAPTSSRTARETEHERLPQTHARRLLGSSRPASRLSQNGINRPLDASARRPCDRPSEVGRGKRPQRCVPSGPRRRRPRREHWPRASRGCDVSAMTPAFRRLGGSRSSASHRLRPSSACGGTSGRHPSGCGSRTTATSRALRRAILRGASGGRPRDRTRGVRSFGTDAHARIAI